MTEQQWAAATEPHPLLNHLMELRWNRTRTGKRKLRVLGCACCRRIERLLDERGRGWLEWAEDLADGLRPPPGKGEIKLGFHPGSTSGQPARQALTATYYALTGGVLERSSWAAWVSLWAVGSEEMKQGGNLYRPAQ